MAEEKPGFWGSLKDKAIDAGIAVVRPAGAEKARADIIAKEAEERKAIQYAKEAKYQKYHELNAKDPEAAKAYRRQEGFKKGGKVKARGVGCAVKGHGKGTMR